MRYPRHLLLFKRRGQTPLEAINVWKVQNPHLAHLPAAYAGRLDPMADGKLLVLLGEECKRQKKYQDLDKEYEIQVVLDIGTDTGDALGMPTLEDVQTHPTPSELQPIFPRLLGTHIVPYPAFSSKTVAGKPLFLHALEGTLRSISIPTHPETIYSISVLKEERISKKELRQRIQEVLQVVPRSEEPSKILGADFRQDSIRSAWSSLFKRSPERAFSILTLRVSCASGTYMRTLAERIAKELGTRGFALTITRTKLGTFRRIGSIHFWLPTY